MKLLYIIILVFLLLPSVVFATDVTEVQNRIDNVVGASPVGTPTAPTGMDQKGYIGMIIGRLFETTGMIKTAFLIPFQTIYNTQINTLPRWNGQSFTLGSIRDNGSNVGIGTGTLNNRRVNVLGDINFSGDLYKDGTLFNPTPTNVVYTIGSQDISGVKTFTNSPTIKNISPTTYLLDTDHRSAMLHVNNNNFYVLRGDGNGSINWTPYNGRWPLQINLENNDATFGGNVGIGITPTTFKLDVNGTFTSRGSDAIRMRQSRYSVIHRNDNENYWILLTNSGSTDDNYNTLRPFKIDLANGNVNLDGNTLAVDATNNYIGIGVARPTDELDVNGKIRMRVQTQATDTPDTVATKKYVDDKMVREEDRLAGYAEVTLNLDEDIYGDASNTGIGRPRRDDTCDGASDSGYACNKNDNKSCRDEFTYTTTRRNRDGETFTDTWYHSRPIICIKALTLVRTEGGAQGMKISNSGTARITSRDYSGWRESCSLSINIPAVGGNPNCIESHSFRLASGFGGGGNDASCEASLESALKTEGVCANFKGVKTVNWNRSGDSGGISIEYFGF